MGRGVPEALSDCKLIDFPQKTLDPPPFLLLTLQNKPDCSI